MLARALAIAVIAFLGLTSNALAQQRPAHGTPSRALYDQAIQAIRAGDWSTALDRFKGSYASSPTSGALEGMANAYHQLDQIGSAYDTYQELALKYPTSMSAEATSRLATLRATTGLLAVEVVGAGATITIDDQPVGTSPMSTTIRVRVGDHKVRAGRPGASPQETIAKVAPNATFVVRLDIIAAQEAPVVKESDASKPAVKGDTNSAIPPMAESWSGPHGSLKYTGVRVDKPIKVDGVLDEPIWQTAPKEGHFLSLRSKPYGKPTTETTIAQIAYDERNLYVAFTCRYSSSRERDDSFPSDEGTLISASDQVAIIIDGEHDHTNAYGFHVARTGARADVEYTQSGEIRNTDWRGIWESATQRGPDEWTAELRIPWSTAAVSSHDEPFQVGLNLQRKEPIIGESALWALFPPATFNVNPNFFGHLSLEPPIRARESLFIQPYLAVAFDQNPLRSGFQSRFYDFLGTGNNRFRAYAGLQVRFRPVRTVQIDGAFNPDFTSVNPDTATTNLDRFELLFVENRPFFADNRARFEINNPPCLDDACSDEPQLFYSRRIGLETGLAGVTKFAPVIYGARMIYRGDIDVAALNVGLAPASSDISMADNISVLRLNKSFGQGRRIGSLAIVRRGDAPGYMASGIDGAYTFFDQHLTFSGWLAESATEQSGKGIGVVGKAQVAWTSQDFFTRASYMEVDKAFDGQLGYFPLIGARTGNFAAGYTPFLANDLVRQLLIVGGINRTRTQTDEPIYERGVIAAAAILTNGAFVQARVRPALEWVSRGFSIGNIMVTPGRYPVTTAEIEASTAPRRKVELAMGYGEGDLFAGYRRSPYASIALNLGRLTTKALYRLSYIHYGTLDAIDHQVSARAVFSFTPLARTVLSVEANTLTARAVVQLATSIGFGELSTLSLVLRESSGVDLSNPFAPARWTDNPNFVAVLSFAYGFTAL